MRKTTDPELLPHVAPMRPYAPHGRGCRWVDRSTAHRSLAGYSERGNR